MCMERLSNEQLQGLRNVPMRWAGDQQKGRCQECMCVCVRTPGGKGKRAKNPSRTETPPPSVFVTHMATMLEGDREDAGICSVPTRPM